MSRFKSALLIQPLFLLNLFLLIANDHWWKYSHPSLLTGKLSDFAGVFVLAVFLLAVTPFKKIYIIIFTALFFTWWKTPLSEPFLNACENIFQIRPVRMIDYSDLLALLILPAALYLKHFEFHALKRVARVVCAGIGIITLAAMMATSPYRVHDYYYPSGHVTVDKQWTTKLNGDQFFHKLDSLHIYWYRDSVELLPVRSDNYLLRIKDSARPSYQWLPIEGLKDTALFFEKQVGTYYVIPRLELEKDTLTNIKFRFYDMGKKRVIDMMSINLPDGLAYSYYMQRPVRKKYMRIFKTLVVD